MGKRRLAKGPTPDPTLGDEFRDRDTLSLERRAGERPGDAVLEEELRPGADLRLQDVLRKPERPPEPLVRRREDDLFPDRN